MGCFCWKMPQTMAFPGERQWWGMMGHCFDPSGCQLQPCGGFLLPHMSKFQVVSMQLSVICSMLICQYHVYTCYYFRMNVAGKIYRKPRILNGQNPCFRVDFPFDQAILFAPVMLRRQGIGGHEGQKGYCQVSFAHGNSHCPCLLLRQHCSSLSTESTGEWRSPIGNNNE